METVFVDEVYYLDPQPRNWASYSDWRGVSCAVARVPTAEAPDWQIWKRDNIPAHIAEQSAF